MQPISRKEVLAELHRREASGEHIDPRLWSEVEAPGEMFLGVLTQEQFLNLIWQETDRARLLTPAGASRTLRDVGSRLLASGTPFETLAGDLELPRTQHHPEWFVPCVDIDRGFDFTRFGWLVLTPATTGERQQSPLGSYYIFDGTHKSLVLSKRILNETVTYQPVTALLLTPRRG